MLLNRLRTTHKMAARFFCISDNGVLVYRTGRFAISRFAWFDRAGKELGTVGTPEIQISPSLSPDQKRVAMIRADQSTGSDIWLLDVSRQSSSRFTFDPAIDSNPVWSPDGTRIVFSSNRLGPYDLYWKLSNGSGNEELLLKSNNAKFVSDWSSDGRFILYQDTSASSGEDLWALPLFGDQKPIRCNRILTRAREDFHPMDIGSPTSLTNPDYRKFTFRTFLLPEVNG